MVHTWSTGGAVSTHVELDGFIRFGRTAQRKNRCMLCSACDLPCEGGEGGGGAVMVVECRRLAKCRTFGGNASGVLSA